MSSAIAERPPLNPGAYHSNEQVKRRALDRMEGHRTADRLIKGTYGIGQGESFKGCMIGCLGGKARHRGVADEFAIPEQLCQLFDCTFEGLAVPEHEQFTVDVLAAIPVGADLSMVIPKFSLWLLTSPEIDLAGKADDVGKAAIGTVAGLYARWIAGDNPPDSEWSAAKSAAMSAAYSAAYSAAMSAAYSAAMSAAMSAAKSAAYSAAMSAARSAAMSAAKSAARSAAESAARSAAYSAAESAARSAVWRLIANQLIALLRGSAS